MGKMEHTLHPRSRPVCLYESSVAERRFGDAKSRIKGETGSIKDAATLKGLVSNRSFEMRSSLKTMR